VADEPQETDPPAAPPAAPAGLSDADVTRVAGAVAAIIGTAHNGAQQVVQDRLSAPGDVAAIVRAELARTDAQARDEATREKVESHAQVIAKLTEAPPVEPRTRRHRFMGWGD
jgi:hypothetical protein